MNNRRGETVLFYKPVNCEKCGGPMIFKGVGEYECEQCGAIAYDDYGKVRNYIEKHPGATLGDVSYATGVSKEKIRQLLVEERIEVAPDSVIFLNCVLCGAEIRSGRYCSACAAKVKQDEQRVAKVVKDKQKKMGYASDPNRDVTGRRRFERH